MWMLVSLLYKYGFELWLIMHAVTSNLELNNGTIIRVYFDETNVSHQNNSAYNNKWHQ